MLKYSLSTVNDFLLEFKPVLSYNKSHTFSTCFGEEEKCIYSLQPGHLEATCRRLNQRESWKLVAGVTYNYTFRYSCRELKLRCIKKMFILGCKTNAIKQSPRNPEYRPYESFSWIITNNLMNYSLYYY